MVPQSVALDEDVDVSSGAGDAASRVEGLHRVCRLLFQLCSEAVQDSAPPPPRICQFEGLFSGVAKLPKEEFSPVLFHRVVELLQELQEVCESCRGG